MRLSYVCPKCHGGLSFGVTGVVAVIGATAIGLLPLITAARMADAPCWLLATTFVAGVVGGTLFMLAAFQLFGRPTRTTLSPRETAQIRQFERIAPAAVPRLVMFMALIAAAIVAVAPVRTERGAQIQDRVVCVSLTLATLGATLGLAEALRGRRGPRD